MPEEGSQTSTEIEEVENASLVRLRLITHNARLVDTRKGRGITQVAMAQRVKMSVVYLSEIELLKRLPTEDDMIDIACILEKPIDYLFPEELMSAVEAGVFSRRKVELAAPQVIALTEAQRQRLLAWDGGLEAVEERLDGWLLAEKIHDVVETLTPREQKVLEIRFGLKDGRSQTLEQVAPEFGVTRARIQQIESKALRRLRHPSRSRHLKAFL